MARDLLASAGGTPLKIVGARRQMAMDLPLVKEQLMRLGLLQTFHQMDRVTRLIGYEIEALETGQWPVLDLSFLERP